MWYKRTLEYTHASAQSIKQQSTHLTHVTSKYLQRTENVSHVSAQRAPLVAALDERPALADHVFAVCIHSAVPTRMLCRTCLPRPSSRASISDCIRCACRCCPRLGARKRVRALRAPRYRYLRNVFVEIIMCVRVANVILLTLMCALGGVVLLFIIPLPSPGKTACSVPQSVDYAPKSFVHDARVVLERKPTDCQDCEFYSHDIPSELRIDKTTGTIEGIAKAGEKGFFYVYATNKKEVVNTTVVLSVAPRFARQFALKVVQDLRGIGFVSAVLYFLFQPQPR